MSADFERLVGRAVIDADFREQLLKDPEGVVKSEGYNLAPDELDKIRESAKQGVADPSYVTEQLKAAAGGSWA